MHASKIIIGVMYAIKRGDKLVRFTPIAVTTRRTSAHNNPQDYKSEVEGIIPAPDNDGQPLKVVVDPDQVLGRYAEYVELVEREAAERAVRHAATEARKALTTRLHKALYRVSGLEAPSDNGWRAPYRLGHGSEDIVINFDGVEALLKALEQVEAVNG